MAKKKTSRPLSAHPLYDPNLRLFEDLHRMSVERDVIQEALRTVSAEKEEDPYFRRKLTHVIHSIDEGIELRTAIHDFRVAEIYEVQYMIRSFRNHVMSAVANVYAFDPTQNFENLISDLDAFSETLTMTPRQVRMITREIKRLHRFGIQHLGWAANWNGPLDTWEGICERVNTLTSYFEFV